MAGRCPKVIDFGVAKATGGAPDRQDLVHRLRGGGRHAGVHEPGTGRAGPAWTSTRAATSTASGVSCTNCLTGTTPLERNRVRQCGFTGGAAADSRGGAAEAEHAADDRRGAGRASPRTAAWSRGKLTALVRGELDWIVMKALEKDRVRRYESANSLSLDIRRYSARRAGAGVPAVGRLSTTEARATEQACPAHDGRACGRDPASGRQPGLGRA